MGIEASDEEYHEVVSGVLSEITVSKIEGIPELLDRMREDVIFADRFKNTDGSSRTTGLKKPRDIAEIEFYLIESEVKAFKKMKNPLGILDNPMEEMKIYRDDGS